MTDRVEQVRLTEPRVAINKQRIVRLGRCLGDGHRRRVWEPVAVADDERLEDVPGVQPRRFV